MVDKVDDAKCFPHFLLSLYAGGVLIFGIIPQVLVSASLYIKNVAHQCHQVALSKVVDYLEPDSNRAVAILELHSASHRA